MSKKAFFTAVTATALLLGASTVSAASTAVGSGRVDFRGSVGNTSCTISVNGQGSDATVALLPVSAAEISSSNTLYKPSRFSIRVSRCSAATGRQPWWGIWNIKVSWVGGNLAGSEGYLANSLASEGARNVYLALSTSNSLAGKIIPGQDAGTTQHRGLFKQSWNFEYYVGYVTQAPGQVTSGPVQSYATYQVDYL